ncbi:Hint domain-containing protein [Paracoccaceae bacterium Fryx2]|nr:Hint domain-containing protein [Paracoccaceae bacterium Fryx2]
MSGWIALSDRDTPLAPMPAGALLDRGALVLELALPLEGPTVLLDYHATDGWARGLSVFHDPQAGFGILHRQGQVVIRHTLPTPLPRDGGTARLTLCWDAPARRWTMHAELPATGWSARSQGRNPLPLPMADLLALCAGGGPATRHPALLWFGATLGDTPPNRAPWIGLRTPVAVPGGHAPAGSLRAGDVVLTADSGPQPLRSVRRMDLPSRGSFAPVLLRAPYFARTADLLVSGDQLIALAGYQVEYLFGEDEVLAEARHMADGRSALFDNRRACTACISLELPEPGLILSDGCALASARHTPEANAEALPRRQLHVYETLPLLALLGRGALHRAA